MGTLKYIRHSLAAAIAVLTVPAFASAADQPVSHTLSGDYLIAHAAEHEGDWPTAARVLNGLWQQSHDPDTLRQAFLFNLGVGDIKTALQLAKDIKPDMAESSIALPLQIADAIKRNDLAEARRLTADLPEHGISVPLSALLNAWLLAARNHTQDNAAALDMLGGVEEFETVKALHTALIDEYTGKSQAAAGIYDALSKAKPTPRIAVFIADYDRRNNRPAEAARVFTVLESEPHDLATLSVRAGANNAPAIKPTVATGTAEAFYDMAELLLDADHPDVALFYAQIALYLAPAAPDTHYLLGEIEQSEARFATAAKDFGEMPAGSHFVLLARLDQILNLERAGDPQQAAIIAETLVKTYPSLIEPRIALGDLQRRQKHFAAAVLAYSSALQHLKPTDERSATLLFARGVAYDQMKQEAAAETDLRQAAQRAPDEPLILNYLGYFWLSKGENLLAARAMLEHAYALAPQDGAIADSLGWALYQSGDYPQAVEKLESAVAATPGDSVINSHLGDAYWQVGRHTEARFQWRRALLNASTADSDSLRAKLRDGLTTPDAPVRETHAAL